MNLKLFGFDQGFPGGNGEASVGSHKNNASSFQRVRVTPGPDTLILVVDDSKTTQMILSKTLSQQGYQTISSYDGESVIQLARIYKPALIMMDVIMPGINGFEATRKLRRQSDPKVANIPIVMMSGNEQATEQFWSMRIGANAFLPKPFSKDDVLDRIEAILYPFLSQESNRTAPAMRERRT